MEHTVSHRRLFHRRKRALITAFAVALALPAAASVGIPDVAGASHGRFASFEPRSAVDLDSRPDAVRVELTAEPGRHGFRAGGSTAIWGYNGEVPGPVIRANVGDDVEVRFCNKLPAEAGATIVHFHGIEAIATMDGSNISQLPVERGDCFDYSLKPLRAATYWYHTHLNSNVQIEHGLAGTFVVSDPAEDAALGLPTAAVAMLDDVLLDGANQIAPELPDDPEARAKMLLDGREGNVLLANGKQDRILDATVGEPLRIRLVNSANARFMRLSIPDQQVWQIGGDAGLLSRAVPVVPVPMMMAGGMHGGHMSDPDPAKGLLLVPGERAEIILNPQGAPGDLIPVQWHDFPRGHHNPIQAADKTWTLAHDHTDGHAQPQTLFSIRLRPSGGRVAPWSPPAALRPVEAIDATGAAPLKSIFGHTMPDGDGNVKFVAQAPGKPFPMVTPDDAQDVSVGQTRIWEVTNLTGSDHPFHAHGFFFQPLEIEYVDTTNPANNRIVPFTTREWMDTIRLPARPGAGNGATKTILRAATVFSDVGREGQILASGKVPSPGRSGGWVFHCHIFEHADNGMMSFIEVK